MNRPHACRGRPPAGGTRTGAAAVAAGRCAVPRLDTGRAVVLNAGGGEGVGPAGRSSVVEVVCSPCALEVYERAGEGAVDALERRLRRLGLRLVVRRRAMCG